MITDLVTMRAPRLAAVLALIVSSMVSVAAGCGGSSAAGAGPAAPAQSGDDAAPAPKKGKRWSGWRYTGARDACFFVVGRACFEDEASACAAAACADGKRCTTDGAGPATVRCE